MTSPPLASGDAAAARAAARAILHESRFHAPSVPRPLHGLLHGIGTALSAPARIFSDAVSKLGSVLPGGVVVAWLVLALLVAGASALIARRYSRLALIGPHDEPVGARGTERAAELERRADAAERDGRLDDAVRLRFRAGLARLSERGAIPPPRSMPTGEFSRILHSGAFDELRTRFEEIAYGTAHAVVSDVEDARRGWTVVLRGADRP